MVVCGDARRWCRRVMSFLVYNVGVWPRATLVLSRRVVPHVVAVSGQSLTRQAAYGAEDLRNHC